MNSLKPAFKLLALASVALILALAPSAIPAQNATTEKQTPGPGAQNVDTSKPIKKPGAGPFHGKLANLDKTARTITVGKRTFQITSETRINRAGKPATLEQAIIGEQVSGYVKPNAQGKLVATTLNLGPKTPSKTGPKQTPTEVQSK